MHQQKSLDVAGKIKAVLARLDRVRVVVNMMGGDIGLKQHMMLFEYVSFVFHEQTPVLTLSQDS